MRQVWQLIPNFLGRSIESDNNLRFTGLQCRIVVGYPAWSWNLQKHHDEPRFSGGWFKFVGEAFQLWLVSLIHLKLYTDVDIKEALNSRRPLKNDASDHHTKPQNDIAFRSSKEYESSFRKQKICRRMIQGPGLDSDVQFLPPVAPRYFRLVKLWLFSRILL